MIEWHKVTWYSWTAAILLFVGTFVLAFDLGILTEKQMLATSIATTPAAPAATTTPAGGAGMTVVTDSGQFTTIHLKLNERFAIELGSDLSWSLAFDPAGSITRVANSIDTGGYQGVYEADAPGTTTMTATGAPICKAGEACPQFLRNVTITFVIGS